MIPPQVAVFGEVPWNTYTVMQVADSDSTAGALRSRAPEFPRRHSRRRSCSATTSSPSLYAHEIFHAWNVKRMRPAEMWPYRYDRPQPTPLLWISEGITDYYADLAEVRGGVIDARGFYAQTDAKIDEIAKRPPIALEDASLSTWMHPRRWHERTSTIRRDRSPGFLLDIMIRDASDNKRSLDTVMRELYETTYKTGARLHAPTTGGARCSRAAGGKSFADFNARYIDGREPYPWDAVLPLAGMRLARDTVNEPRVGIGTVQDSTGVHVTEVVLAAQPRRRECRSAIFCSL